MISIPLARPAIGREEISSVSKVLRSGWLVHGPENRRLEAMMAEYFGLPHAVTMNSGTSALLAALLGLKIRGEVICPSFTMSATVNAVVAAGAKPVFCDVDERTGNLDPKDVRRRISARTEAIIPVHFAGQPCDIEAVMRLARRYGLKVIEDSAECLGGKWQGRLVGTFGNVGCFSFWASKNITTGEGGAVITGNKNLARRMRALSAHGIVSSTEARRKTSRPWQRDAILPGYNLRMSNIAAAIGVEQFKKLKRLNALRRAHAQRLIKELSRIPDLRPLEVLPQAEHVYQMFVVRVPTRKRDWLVGKLRSQGIEASVHFDPPVHLQTYYRRRFGRIHLPVTERLAKECITLPLFPTMQSRDIDRIAGVLRRLMKR